MFFKQLFNKNLSRRRCSFDFSSELMRMVIRIPTMLAWALSHKSTTKVAG
jgi:hypothetical protein